MKVNSISCIHAYVQDLSRTAKFYEAIGFRRGKEEPDRLTFYVNWFFVTFIAQDQEADAELKKEARLQEGFWVIPVHQSERHSGFLQGCAFQRHEARRRATRTAFR